MRKGAWRTLWSLLLSASLGSQGALATAFSLTQITTSGPGGCQNAYPAISADGANIVFMSNCNLTGTDNDGNLEIYRFNVVGNSLTQITTSPSGCTNGFLSIDADGTTIAFASNCNLTGSNGDGNYEIYHFNGTTDMLAQITAATACDNQSPVISADGTTIAFVSNCNLTGGNSDGNYEVYRYDTVGDSLTQITTSPSTCTNGAFWVNADGAQIGLASNCDLTAGAGAGNYAIYRYDTVPGGLTQITALPASCRNGSFSFSADGTRLAFQSDCNLTGSDGDGNLEIYRLDTTTGMLTQLTTTTGCASQFPAISADGTQVVFTSNCNLTGANGDHNDEIYRLETVNDTVAQVTSSSSCTNLGASINADGTTLAFWSDCNLTGANGDRNDEIYRAASIISTPTPTLTPTQSPPPTATPAMTDTPDPIPTATPTALATPAVTPTPCVGDCNADGCVSIDDLLTMVNIALGNASFSDCTSGDGNGNGEITIDEILVAVRHALEGCQ